jgi:hypothetical protein
MYIVILQFRCSISIIIYFHVRDLIVGVEDNIVTWLQACEVNIDELQTVRRTLNRPDALSLPDLQATSRTITLLAVLRRYLMELPVPLFPFEEYDTFKTLYLSSTHRLAISILTILINRSNHVESEDSHVRKRVASVKSILSTLSPVRQVTLERLMRSMKRYVSITDIISSPNIHRN